MVFKSSYPNIDIPDVGIYQFVTSNPNKISDNKAIFIDGITEKKVTFGELKSNSKKLAAGLQTIGFKRGDVLAIFSHNVVDYPIVFFGAIAAGGIITSSNPLISREDELTFNLVDSNASIIFVHPNYLDVIVKVAEDVKIPKSKIFLLGEEVDGFQSYCSLIGDHEIEPISYTSEEARTTTAFLGSSSGTTGKPKKIEITHKNVIAGVLQLTAVDFTEVGNIFMGLMPFSNMYGMIIIAMTVIFLGDPIIVIPRFELGLFYSCIQKYKISYAHVSLPIVRELVKNPIAKNYDISSLKMVFSTGAPLSKLMSENFYNIHKIPIKQGYGLTEVSVLTINKSNNIVAGSVGGLIPNIEAKIVSEEGLELGCNEPGELWVRCPTLAKGYLNNEDATKASFDKDGFFHTGDLVFVDDNMNFFIIGRIKELIKSTHPVAPTELEEILLTHPAVADTAVLGYYSAQHLIEFPTAYVVTKPEYEQTSDLSKDLQRYINDKVASHKKLRGGVLFTDQIPRNPMGKILRRILKDKLKTEFVYPIDT